MTNNKKIILLTLVIIIIIGAFFLAKSDGLQGRLQINTGRYLSISQIPIEPQTIHLDTTGLVPMMKLELKANGMDEITLNELKLLLTGSANYSIFEKVTLHDDSISDDTKNIIATADLSGLVTPIFKNINFVVKKQPISLTVKADLAQGGAKTIQFWINENTDVKATGPRGVKVRVEGTFPIEGPTHTIYYPGPEIPQLSVTKNTNFPDSTFKAGTSRVKIGSFVMSAGTNQEDVEIITLQVGAKWSGGTVTNLQLYQENEKIGYPVNKPENSIPYVFTPFDNLILKSGESTIIDVYVDTATDVSGNTIIAGIPKEGIQVQGLWTNEYIYTPVDVEKALYLQTMTGL